MSALPPTELPPLPDLERPGSAAELKGCCAAVYGHPAVRWLLGDELHPGGEAGTLRALELGGVRTGDRLLDVAAGQGTSARLAARELGCEVTGLEYGADAVAAASAAAAAQGLAGRVGFLRGDAEELPFAAASFDAVLCECSLCTFAGKRRAAAEMRRVLRPGGRLVLADVVADRSRLPEGLLGPLALVACVGDALDRPGYERLLTASGLDVVAVEERDGDAAALARRVHDRLRGARVLGLEPLAGAPLTIDAAVALLDRVRRAIDEGALGYTIFVAERPAAGGPG